MSEIPVWLDCDPGHDDAVALLLACALPHFHLHGVSTVFGNSSLENTTSNAMSLLTAFHSIETAVYPGAEKPLAGFLHTADSIHGQSGLDGTSLLPLPLMAKQPDHTAVLGLAQALTEFDGQLSVVATGPLTNIALLINEHPEVVSKIKCLSIMGGGFGEGNWTPHAEFNIWSDPQAAQTVFSCDGLANKTVLVPINLTHQMIATEDILEHVKRGPALDKYTVFRQMMYELLTYFADTYRTKFGFVDGPPVHDPVALVILLALFSDTFEGSSFSPLPDFGFKFSRAHVEVVLEGEQRGRTTAHPLQNHDYEQGVLIAASMNPAALWNLVSDSILYLESA